jgi:hypothetical protein
MGDDQVLLEDLRQPDRTVPATTARAEATFVVASFPGFVAGSIRETVSAAAGRSIVR